MKTKKTALQNLISAGHNAEITSTGLNVRGDNWSAHYSDLGQDHNAYSGQTPNEVEQLAVWDEESTRIKITNYTNAGQMPDESGFDYVVEVAAWVDTGTTEYIGINGQPTHTELHDMLGAEVARIHDWIDSESKTGGMETRTDEPQVAVVRQRPEADEDGDFPPSHGWPIIIDFN